ncbi:hypothetical protein D0T50_12315 [Bacteroides sp. 214]|nr:hypothetical protein [Bacteroides sp. 214]
MYPLVETNGNGDGFSDYIDYNDPNQMSMVNALKISSKVWDYAGTLGYFSSVAMGIGNHLYYNKNKFRIR